MDKKIEKVTRYESLKAWYCYYRFEGFDHQSTMNVLADRQITAQEEGSLLANWMRDKRPYYSLMSKIVGVTASYLGLNN